MLPSESWSPSSRPRLFLRDEIQPPMTGARKRLGSYPSSLTIDLINPFRSPVSWMEKSRVYPSRASISRRRIRAHMEWNVPIHGAPPSPAGTRRSTRSRISFAALLVKVIARISHGATPRFKIRFAMRVVTTRVFPEPGPATIRRGPSPLRTASCCCGFKPSVRLSSLCSAASASESFTSNQSIAAASLPAAPAPATRSPSASVGIADDHEPQLGHLLHCARRPLAAEARVLDPSIRHDDSPP